MWQREKQTSLSSFYADQLEAPGAGKHADKER